MPGAMCFPLHPLICPPQFGEGCFPTCPQGNRAPHRGADSGASPQPFPRQQAASWGASAPGGGQPGLQWQVRCRHPGATRSWVGRRTSGVHLGRDGPLPVGSAPPLEEADIKPPGGGALHPRPCRTSASTFSRASRSMLKDNQAHKETRRHGQEPQTPPDGRVRPRQ